MPTFDPYRVLQVHPEADTEIIQVAYRKLAQRHHPDIATDPEAARRMAELNAARDLLLDPVARSAYDRDRRGREHPAGAGPVAATPWPAPADAAAAGSGTGSAGGSGSPAGQASAGPPPGNPSGSVLSFGRYAGWSLGEIARRDIEYVEWLDRIPIGRPYRAEIDALLRARGRRGGSARPEEPHGLDRRR